MTALCVRVYRLVLLLYPGDVRDRDGVEMIQLFSDLVEEARRRHGVIGATTKALGIYAEALRSGLGARRRSRHARRPSSTSRGSPVTSFAGLAVDLRSAGRSLMGSPGFTIVAVVTLALGIGGTTAMFTLLHATLLRPLPFNEADRLAVLYLTRTGPGQGMSRIRWSYPEFETLRETDPPFEALASFNRAEFNLTDGDEPYHVWGEVVSAAYFDVLRVEPVTGRAFVPGEDQSGGGSAVAMVSYELWQGRLGGALDVHDKAVRVNGVAVTVVGVLPPGFKGLTGRAEVWVPHGMGPSVYYPDHLTTHQHYQHVVGRLGNGRTFEAANSSLEALAGPLAERFGADHGAQGQWGATLLPLDAARIDPTVRRSSLVLFGAAFLVLMIASANLAGLLLGRGLSQRRDMAIRRALGSSRARLVRKALTESVLLSLLGGGAGIFLTFWLTRTGTAFVTARLPTRQLSQFAEPSVDGRVLVFALVVSLVVGVAFGLGPALVAARPGHNPLRGRSGTSSKGSSDRHLHWPSTTLVVSEFALALVLLVGATLLLQTLINLHARNPGFDPEGVITFRIQPPLTLYSAEDGPRLLAEVIERVSAVPGVASVSVGPCGPLMTTCASREVRLPPEVDPEGTIWPIFRRHYVASGHFETLGIPVIRGRGLLQSDGPASPNAAVVNRRAAETLWPGQDPLGKRVVLESGNFIGPDSTALVVGVVADVQYGRPDEAIGLDLYTSYLQFSRPSTYVMVRTDVPLSAIVPELRRAVHEVDSDLPIYDSATMTDRADRSLARSRFNGILLGGFAMLALSLSGIGVYGVMSQFVSRRSREMGIRMAVGAGRGALLRLVVGKALTLALAGVALGTVGALGMTRVLSSQLWGISTTDPIAFGTAVIFLLSVGLAAVYVPARRATRVDPVVVLRSE